MYILKLTVLEYHKININNHQVIRKVIASNN